MSLCFNSVQFRYPRTSRPVLAGFSWHVPDGRTVLLGPNGAGKSTILALGANALRPTCGSVRFRSLDPTRRSHRAPYRRAVGWMPQQVRAVPGLTVREQVAYAGWLKGQSRSHAWAAALTALDRVGLVDVAVQKATTLSGGQLRRVGLAQVLVHDADTLLLDEPTVGLDPAQRARFRAYVAALPRERPVVISTHQVDDLSDLFDTVVVVAGGVIRFSASVPDFLALAPDPGTERRAEAAYARIVADEG